jgi:hypothetical protein
MIKNSILPYLISHSTESENKELIEELLKNQIEIAKENNDSATLIGITSFLEKLKNPEFESDEGQVFEMRSGVSTSESEPQKLSNITHHLAELEFSEDDGSPDNLSQIGINQDEILYSPQSLSWEDLIELSLNQNDEEMIKRIEQFVGFSKNETDKIRASLLLSKLYTEAEKFSEAARVLTNLNYKVNHSSPSETDILFLNAKAILEFKKGNLQDSIRILQEEAAPLSIKLGPEFKLLTLSNIAIVLKDIDMHESQKYSQQVIKQARNLKYDSFLEDFQNNYA